MFDMQLSFCMHMPKNQKNSDGTKRNGITTLLLGFSAHIKENFLKRPNFFDSNINSQINFASGAA